WPERVGRLRDRVIVQGIEDVHLRAHWRLSEQEVARYGEIELVHTVEEERPYLVQPYSALRAGSVRRCRGGHIRLRQAGGNRTADRVIDGEVFPDVAGIARALDARHALEQSTEAESIGKRIGPAQLELRQEWIGPLTKPQVIRVIYLARRFVQLAGGDAALELQAVSDSRIERHIDGMVVATVLGGVHPEVIEHPELGRSDAVHGDR